MPRLCRKVLIAILVALHASVMVCGTCLHALPGWEHGAGVPGAKGKVGTHDLERSLHGSAHDCPICHLHSLGQIPLDLDQDWSTPLICTRDLWEQVVLVLPSSRGPASLRAPPCFALNLV